MELPRRLVTDLRTALGDPALLAAAPHLGPIPIVFNLPALAIVALITWLLVIGTKESARVNTVMVAIKVGIIAMFLIVGLKYIKPALWTTPSFAPNGFKGISVGAAIIFFSRSEEHTSELQSPCNLVCRLLLEKKKNRVRPARRRLRS